MSYISVHNWGKFQHYSKRNSPWVKNYVDLISKDEYLGLTGHRRAILHGLWLIYSMSHARLRDDTAMISSRLAMRVTRSDLESLVEAGFIDIVASSSLAECSHGDSTTRARVETEAEAEPSLEGSADSNGSRETPPTTSRSASSAQVEFKQSLEPCVVCERVKGEAALFSGQWWCEECFTSYWQREDAALEAQG